jgi:ATP-dependent Clp protease adaptor protein ClpS
MTYKSTMGPDDGGIFGSGSAESAIAERKPEVRTPSLFKVLLHNDDFTPMEFVVMILETYFSKDRTAAADIMLAVHHKGVGVCGVFPYEIAETKVSLVMECARENEHPLQCSMEKV